MKHENQLELAPDAELTVNERARLKELERRNRELEMEVTFLKKPVCWCWSWRRRRTPRSGPSIGRRRANAGRTRP